jgi:hypothetical protein
LLRPDDSVCMTHIVKTGDILIISSDGLFDNLYEDEIALIVDNHIKENAIKVFKSSATVKTETSISTTIMSIDELNSQKNPSNLVDHKEKADVILATTVNQTKSFITSDLLNSACELLIQKASKG